MVSGKVEALEMVTAAKATGKATAAKVPGKVSAASDGSRQGSR